MNKVSNIESSDVTLNIPRDLLRAFIAEDAMEEISNPVPQSSLMTIALVGVVVLVTRLRLMDCQFCSHPVENARIFLV